MIPDFNASGVLPPFLGEDPGQMTQSSPYRASMSEIVAAFGTTPERRQILRGLLGLRGRLRAVGMTTGFQIIDGSFVESVEATRGRPPADVDLVTFVHVPAEDKRAFLAQNQALFDRDAVKAAHKCDSFVVDLGADSRSVVGLTMYWYGLFAHQRETFMWKGLLRVELMSDDNQALELLEAAEAEQPNA